MTDLLAFWLLASTVAFGLRVVVCAIFDRPAAPPLARVLDCAVKWSARVKTHRKEEREKLARRETVTDLEKQLTDALQALVDWWYADYYDGPETRFPEALLDAEDLLKAKARKA